MNDEVTVVFRTIGERTQPLCQQIVEKEVSPSQVHVVSEIPFRKTLQKGYRVGLNAGRRFTLFIDGDILLAPGSLTKLLSKADTLPKTVYAMKASLLDTLLGFVGSFGMMLYQTHFLERALIEAEHADKALKAEKHVICSLDRLGFDYLRWDCPPLGFSDYEQYFKDLYRTSFVHAIKHPEWAEWLLPFWRNNSSVNPDYIIALEGFSAGIARKEIPQVQDVTKFPSIEEILASHRLEEKTLLQPFYVEEQLQSFSHFSAMRVRFKNDGVLRKLSPSKNL